MPTIRDVAKRAGVAPITVSRVINRSGYVSDETRARVEAAIEELQYVPNTLARGLRVKQTKTLALILTDITNPFWTTVARGVEDVASMAGYNVIFCNTDESEAKQADYLQILFQKRVDGILLVPAKSTPEAIQAVQNRDTAMVVLDRRVPGAEVDVVRCESEEAAYQLVQHLINLGHRHIAALSGPEDVSTAKDRVLGYERAMAEAGLEANMQVFYGEYTQRSGHEMTQKALRASPRPTALFAGNNFIAMGAFQAVYGAGLDVPGDLSVVAFDDIPPSMVINPFLTVAAQPGYEIGRRATELLLQRLSGAMSAECQEIILPTEITIRQSSSPPHRE